MTSSVATSSPDNSQEKSRDTFYVDLVDITWKDFLFFKAFTHTTWTIVIGTIGIMLGFALLWVSNVDDSHLWRSYFKWVVLAGSALVLASSAGALGAGFLFRAAWKESARRKQASLERRAALAELADKEWRSFLERKMNEHRQGDEDVEG